MNKGFTFIEIILVLSIILIIVGLSASFYSRFLLENAVANTVEQMVGSLRKAQINSMVGKQASAWSVNFSSNTITLYKGTSFAGRNVVFDEKFSVNTNVSVTGISDVSFSKITGLPTPPVSTITISAGTDSETITINNQGVASK